MEAQVAQVAQKETIEIFKTSEPTLALSQVGRIGARVVEATARVEANVTTKIAETTLALSQVEGIGARVAEATDQVEAKGTTKMIESPPLVLSREKKKGVEGLKSFDPHDLPHNQRAREGDESEVNKPNRKKGRTNGSQPSVGNVLF